MKVRQLVEENKTYSYFLGLSEYLLQMHELYGTCDLDIEKEKCEITNGLRGLREKLNNYKKIKK